MISLAQAQSYITSTVGFDGSKYHYEYIVDASIDKRDIDTITLDLCDSCDLYDLYTNYRYELEYGKDYIEFDDIKYKKEEYLIFGFYSDNAPEMQKVEIDNGKKVFKDSVWSPSCVPEPTTFLCGVLGTLLLLKRRK